MRIAIASGKGGTGKTFVSTHLFSTLKSMQQNVILVDCDAEVPNSGIFIEGQKIDKWPVKTFIPDIDLDKCVFCGQCAEYCSFNAITCIPDINYITLLPDLCHGCHACEYACKHKAIRPRWSTLGMVTAYASKEEKTPHFIEARVNVKRNSPVPVIRDAIEHGIKFSPDILLMDAPPGCSCPFVNTVLFANFVILVAEPTPFGISDLKHTLDVLAQLSKPCGVIINRADIGDDKLTEYLKEKGIPILARIPYSDAIAESYSRGEITTDTEIQHTFTHLTKTLLEYENSYC